ncbi:MAG: DNA polymerase III subunit gamma/tau [Myxococcota bacterium]
MYEVLARRSRPQSFDEVAGQTHVTTALANAIRLDRVPHALLLCGPRGVGKTSIARILARSLNCDQGPTPSPCGSCSPCLEIAAGTSLDVQEIDAASHTGVDHVREIRESIRYAAAPGKHRIFIIDEVHMLSTAAFNALLKTLEEPPPQSLFVFATTDPQKIPQTVLSRVQRFDLKRLGAREMYDRLADVIQGEKFEIPESIVRSLVREGDGSLRDSLMLLDRLVSALGPKVSESDALAILDLVERRVVLEVIDPVLASDAAGALAAVRQALDQGIEPARLAAELLSGLRDLLVAAIAGEVDGLIQAAPDELAELRERARAHDPETYQRLFRVLLQRQQDLAWAPRPSQALEMAVVRMATLADAESISQLVARVDALGRGESPKGGGAAPGGGSGARTRAAAAAGRRPRSKAKAPPVGASPPPEAPSALEDTPQEASPSQKPMQGEAAPVGEEAPDRGGAPSGGPPAPSEVQRQAELRAKARSHPSVRDAIDVLDAELREIRLHRREEPGS